MSSREFIEFVSHDLKHIVADLKGFLEVYYPMLQAIYNPQNESDFILGWVIGSKEQEYSQSYYAKYGKRIHHELLFEVQREILKHKEELLESTSAHLNKKES
jgi:hypothetical protein